MFIGAVILKEFKGRRLVAMGNYEVIARTLCRTSAVGLLANSIAAGCRLRRASGDLFSVRLSLIWHRDRFPASARSPLLQTILDALT